jgi:hypothetical protein
MGRRSQLDVALYVHKTLPGCRAVGLCERARCITAEAVPLCVVDVRNMQMTIGKTTRIGHTTTCICTLRS